MMENAMSAEILPFPKPRMPTGLPDPHEHQERIQEHRRQVILHVRSAAEDPASKFERDDEIAPARAINKLIVEAKDQKITQRHIRKALAKANLNIRHLERLRVDHIASPEEAKKRASSHLIRKVQRYVRVLDVLAEALGRSSDEVVFNAFRETAFGRLGTLPIESPPARLNWLLHEMTNWVVHSEKVHDYFQEVRRFHAGYDPTTNEFLYGELGAEYQAAYDGSVDWSLTVHPIPAVPLLRVHRATFVGPLEVEKKPVAPKESSRVEVAAICNPRVAYETGKCSFSATGIVDAEISLFTDIRLAVAPRTLNDDLGPVFEVRSHVRLQTLDSNRTLTFDYSSFPLSACNDVKDSELDVFVGSVAAQFDTGWHRVSGFGKRGWKLKLGEYSTNLGPEIDPSSPAGPADRDPKSFGVTLDSGIVFDPLIGSERAEWATSWSAVNPVTVNQFMQLLSQPVEERRWQWLAATDGPGEKPIAFHSFDPGCREFETALFTGAIERALAEECRRLSASMAQASERNKALLAQQTAAALDRWRTTD
ncbi:MAG: hypothetical protein QOF72_2784 [Blastocatellia bacterium]|jgi:hypothetical protein|nr:hypothetical protein [Blastocatellia bacterium]